MSYGHKASSCDPLTTVPLNLGSQTFDFFIEIINKKYHINEIFNKELTTYFWTFGGLRPASIDLRLMLVLELAGDWVIWPEVVDWYIIFTLKGNVNAFLTPKHVWTNDVKNHVFTLGTPKWPLTQWLLRGICWAWLVIIVARFSQIRTKYNRATLSKQKWD